MATGLVPPTTQFEFKIIIDMTDKTVDVMDQTTINDYITNIDQCTALSNTFTLAYLKSLSSADLKNLYNTCQLTSSQIDYLITGGFLKI